MRRQVHDPDSLLASVTEWAAQGLDIARRVERLGASDGLPMVSPTPERVVQVVEALGGDPDRVIAGVPPLRSPLTVASLATVAVLAGAGAEQARTIEACVSALAAPELNALGVLTTTGSAAFVVVVNGPVRSASHYNSGTNCLGPGNRSNAVTGRALSLVTRMVGGAREGLTDMATTGQPGKYTFCFAENEEASRWSPLHVEAGHEPAASTVTLMGVSGTIEAFNPAARSAEEMVTSLCPVLAAASPEVRPDLGMMGGGNQMIVISPEWAQAFDDVGIPKSEVRELLFERASAQAGRRVAHSPGDIVLVVAGGAGVKQTVIPGWNGGSSPVTVPILR